jgi:hypothetical protein
MAEGKKNLAQLRAEVRGMMATIQDAPSKMRRADLERMKEILGAAAEKDKSIPIPDKTHRGGRKKAAEVEGAEKDGIAVPKKLVKEKTQYAVDKEKKAKATIKPGKLDDDSDSGTGSESEAEEKKAKVSSKKVEKAAVEPTSAPTPAEKKKRVISPEHLAKMKAAREAKKAGGDAAKPTKKDNAPPDAPSKKEKPVKEKDDSSQFIRLPVFNLG